MDYYLFLARSVTRAQKMDAELRRRGIHADLVRPPVQLSEKGCAYALRLTPRRFSAALHILETSGLTPTRVFHYNGEGYEEL